MSRTKTSKILDNLSKEIDSIVDDKSKNIQKILLNLVEQLISENDVLRAENQQQRDEINRLKGEQGRPNIREQKKDKDDEGDDGSSGSGSNDHSSENERKKGQSEKPRKPKQKKKQDIKIDREVFCRIPPNDLPSDAVFKGYESVVIQDLKIITDNIEFKRESWYSPSLKKTFLGDLPDGYQGEFGPEIRTLVVMLYRDSGMTEPGITRLLKTWGIHISRATISRMLIDGHDVFHQEKEDIVTAGMQSIYQQIDDTSCRVNGKNHYTHIICNPYFTAYFTEPKKDRLTLFKILCRDKLMFSLDQDAYELMAEFGLSEKRIAELKKISVDGLMTKDEVDRVLDQLFPGTKKRPTNRRIITESMAISYYKNSEYAIKYLMSDDAPQFKMLAEHKALCWIHEGRHYKKLNPIVEIHRNILDDYIEKFWDFYHELLKFKENPSSEFAKQLSKQFDELFSTVSGYEALDDRIAKTLAKKAELLLVLSYPFLPLHNNSAELGARVQARMRDINLQTINEKGTKAKDTFATIVQTANKLGVNIYNYLHDRISKKFAMPSLADLISEKNQIDEKSQEPFDTS